MHAHTAQNRGMRPLFSTAAQGHSGGTPLSVARTAFTRVWNLRSIAIVFYFSLLLILGRYITALHYEPLEQWAFDIARGMRQTMISGLLLLLAIALTEAFAAAKGLSPRRALALGVLASAIAASLSVPARLFVAGFPFVKRLTETPGFFVSTFTLWTAIGALGYWFFTSARADREARCRLADAECRQQALQAQMCEAQLTALQAQIEPHFLFNTLANVKRLYETAPDQGREMLASLINYLRAALPAMRESGSTLGRELELARSFLTILKMRMRERLDFSIDHDPSLANARVPPMVLPTLVENAIKHGLSPLPEGGRIDIHARREGDDLLVEVRDNGAGFSGSTGAGVGLANTRSRLSALYGARAKMTLTAGAPRGVTASIRLPVEWEAAAA
ncbi:MAG TPA: histidine kinase [Burkholderiaceae bacterium]|nr:histidine kinase [Burkholderiaceae bacterium]